MTSALIVIGLAVLVIALGLYVERVTQSDDQGTR